MYNKREVKVQMISEYMTKEVTTVDKDQELKYVIELMKKHGFSKIPVLDEKKIVGLITDNMIAYKLGSIRTKEVTASRMHASSVMDKNIEIVTPETKVKEVLKKVGEPGPTLLAVVEDEALVGVITKADLLPLVKSGKRLHEVMRTDLKVVSPTDRVIHARRVMIDDNVARLLVMDADKLVGIISDVEIAFAFADLKENVSMGHQKHRLEELQVQDVMKQTVFWTTKDVTCAEASSLMLKHQIGCLPVMNEGKVAGIVTRTDLLKTIPM